MNEVKAYVTKADGKIVRVKAVSNSVDDKVLNLGFIFDADFFEYKIQISSNEQKAELFNELRNIGVAFSSGKEWCPSEVFEYLRDSGLLNGSFIKISWKEPGNYYVTTE